MPGFGIIMAASRLRDPLVAKKLREVWFTITLRADLVRGEVDKESQKSNLNMSL